jgi:hypothetical protein
MLLKRRLPLSERITGQDGGKQVEWMRDKTEIKITHSGEQ